MKLLKYDNDINYKNEKFTSRFTNLFVYPWRDLGRMGCKCVVHSRNTIQKLQQKLANYISHQELSISNFIIFAVLDEMVKLFGIRGNKIAIKMTKQTRIVIRVIHVKNNFDQANIGNNILNIGKTSQTIWTMCIISPSTTQSLFSMKWK